MNEFVITIAMDAFRLCIGAKPRNHDIEDVIRWMRLISRARKDQP